MAVTYGFFNSVNGDRKYNADQMSEYFRGIVSQGVFQHLDSGMAVSAGTGLSVSVAAGRAIIQNRWVQNSAALNLTISDASETYGRKDAVVIRLNKSSRAISIAVKTGTPAASPVAPSMTRDETTYEMALAYVNVAAGASSVTVTDKRSDSSVCGWASVAQATSGEVDQMLNAMKTGFDGVVYSSPAAMVQGEDQKLRNFAYAVSEAKTITPTYTDGVVVRKTGYIEPNSGWCRTDFVEINGFDKIIIKGTLQAFGEAEAFANLLFFEDLAAPQNAVIGWHTFGQGAVNVDEVVSIPENAKFFVFCNQLAKKSGIELSLIRTNATKQFVIDGPYSVSDYMDRTFSKSGITGSLSNGVVTLDGTISGSGVSMWLYYSKDQYLLKNGKSYVVNFIPSETSNAYLQIYNNFTDHKLISAQVVRNQTITIPSDATNVFARVLVAAGTYDDVNIDFSIEEAGEVSTEYEDIKITTAQQIYDFMKNPKSYKRLILDPKEYDLYTGLFETDILNDISFPIDLFMKDVEIIGNNATLKLHVPKAVVDEKTAVVNTYSVINAIGNIHVKDLTIDAFNCRYSFHSESLDDTSAYYAKQIFDNCRIIYGTDTNGLNANAIGIGGSLGQKYEFNNCVIKDTANKTTFYIHTRGYNMAELNINSCRFDNRNDYGITLSQYTGNGIEVMVNITDSYVGNIAYITQSGGNPSNQYKIKAINSYIPDIRNMNSTTILYDPERINTLTGEIDNTYTTES